MENTAAIVIKSEQLSVKEQRRFDACVEEYKKCGEAVEKGFVDQARILKIICDEKLYREKYGTAEGAFTEFCKAELGEDRSTSWVYSSITKLEACEIISEAFGIPVGEVELSFRSARIIKQVDPADVAEVVESAMEQSGKITPKSLEGAISKIEDRDNEEVEDDEPIGLLMIDGSPADWKLPPTKELQDSETSTEPTETDLAEAEESAFTTTDESNQERSLVEEFGDAADVRPVKADADMPEAYVDIDGNEVPESLHEVWREGAKLQSVINGLNTCLFDLKNMNDTSLSSPFLNRGIARIYEGLAEIQESSPTTVDPDSTTGWRAKGDV